MGAGLARGRVRPRLTISDETLLAAGTTPAWLEGHGPIPAGTARHLAATAHQQALATLRRLYVTPTTGQLVAMESTARTFPTGLARFIDLRDQTCRTPWCDAPIRHHDHLRSAASGGPTTAANGQGLCARCNYAKERPGWPATPGTGPPDLPPPTPHRPMSPAEIYLSQWTLAV